MYLKFDTKRQRIQTLATQSLTILICLCFFAWTSSASLKEITSSAYGGFVVILGHGLFSQKILGKTGACHQRAILMSFYTAALLQWASTVLSCIILFHYLKPIAFPFFLTYITTQFGTMIALYRQGLSTIKVRMHV